MSTALRTTLLLVIGLAPIGCGQDPAGNGPAQSRTKADQPRTKATSNLPTVTLKIPGMSWPVGWPRRVRTALATLPWVEQDSIAADVGTHLATFAVKDKSKFNVEQVKEALKEQQFPEVELISGPDTSAPAKENP